MSEKTKNSGYIDLHIHSIHSDGLHSPAELVGLAARKGLRAIALTDHDSVSGIDEAMETGKRLGVEVIPGVELSVSHEGYRDVHLLGYLIDHHDAEFRAMLERFRKSRDERGVAVMEKLNARLRWENREEIDYREVQSLAVGAVGRPHMARALMERGYVKSLEDAFIKYLVPCNVPKFHIRLADAAAEIRRIGGVAVLAHPLSVSNDRQTLKRLVAEVARMGVEGLEVFSNMCYKDDTFFINNLARQSGLLATGGSDFHDTGRECQIGIAGGAMIPYELLERLMEVREKRGRTISIQRA